MNKPFVIYNASAGSGKTFTLVKEYLKICLRTSNPNRYKSILAITFTNKAAAEMKERVLLTLKVFASGELEGTGKALFEQIVEETGLSPEEVEKRSQNILEDLLHNYSAFSISTIDKFTHRIIRTFALDLELPANFEVELDRDRLLSESVDLLISRAGSDDELTQALLEFTESKTDDEKSWHIERDIAQIGAELMNEGSREALQKLKDFSLEDFFVIRTNLQKQQKQIEKKVKEIGIGAIDLINEQGIDPKSFYYADLPNFFKKLLNSKPTDISVGVRLAKNMNEGILYSNKANEIDAIKIDGIQNDLVAAYEQGLAVLEKEKPRYIINDLILKNFYALAVLHEVEKQMDEVKSRNNLMHISEFNQKIADVISEQPVPFIYERLGERYHHYFIDEFQDTSVLQWKNLMPLVENSVSKEGGSTMLVGDGKQAIYRWRGGEVEQFLGLSENEDVSNKVKVGDSILTKFERQVETLDTNWRSFSEVIEFNNSFFQSAATRLQNPAYQQLFEKASQQINHNKGGYIHIEYIEYSDEFEAQNCKKTLDTIKELRQDGFTYGDIAILTRKNQHGTLLANYLMDNQVPVISTESLLLSSSNEVQFLISLLRVIAFNEDYQSRLSVLEYIIQNSGLDFNDEEKHNLLASLAKTTLLGFFKGLNEQGFAIDFHKLNTLPLYELAEEIARSFNLLQKADAYVQFFMDAVFEYAQKSKGGLRDFMEWWDEKSEKLSINMPDDMDAVRIMTIHKAKGLEFPVVLFPFANWEAQSENSPKLWIELDESYGLPTALISPNKSLEETEPKYQKVYQDYKAKVQLDNLNLLYVAFTRPVQRLYVFTSPTGRSRNLSEYITGYLKDKDVFEKDKLVYTFGEPEANKGEEDKKPETILFKETISEDWRDRIFVSKSAPLIWEVDDVSNATEWGNLVHTAMSRIRVTSDLPDAIESMYLEGLMDDDYKVKIESLVKRLLSMPEIQPYFEEGLEVKLEADLLLTNGDSLRPDRVVIHNPLHATILDYKTGGADASHTQQLDEYAHVLQQTGFEKVSKVLVYLGKEQFIKRW